MKIKLLKESKIRHYAGEVVEASPEEAAFLIAVGSAEKAEDKPKPSKKTK